MLHVLAYVVSITFSSALGWKMADLASRIGFTFGQQIATFCGTILVLLVITILSVESDTVLGRFIYRIARCFAAFFKFIYYVVYQLGDEIYSMTYPVITDRLKVYKNGASVAVWNLSEEIPNEVLLMGFGSEDCEKAARGAPVTIFNNGCIELIPVAPGFKSKYKPA